MCHLTGRLSNWKNVQGRGKRRYHTLSCLVVGEGFTPSWQASFSSLLNSFFYLFIIEHDTRR
jgi:hypothetical protein